MAHTERLLILDFGSLYTQNIARQVRGLKVYSEIFPYTASIDTIREFAPKGIVLSGSPAPLDSEDAPSVDPALFELGVPVLGIGYGQRLMAKLLGGTPTTASVREFGPATVTVLDPQGPLGAFEKGDEIDVWMHSGESFDTLPDGFKAIASSSEGLPAAIANDERRLYGVSFHPEVETQTPRGEELIGAFLDLCGFERNWTPKAFIDEAVRVIREQTEGKRVLCAMSGGVDSAVAAMLIHRAIGDRLRCIFVDNGLLRQGERKQVEETFDKRFHLPLTTIDASKRFLGELEGVSDPEQKRKIIGRVFIEVFEDAVAQDAAEHGEPEFLAQGTLYPDVIESVSVKGGTVAIKSHHNVGGLPERMKLKLLEPLRELFKDEVRAVGRELGLPEEVVERQPFPGPGLSIRVLGAVSPERVATIRAADAIVREEIHRAGLHREIWQFFAVLLPVKTVGVTNDVRTYEDVCTVRGVTSVDGMTADWARIPHEVLATISNRIVKEVPGINRVTYDITGKPPGTIEWE